jgi:hypothetical protein
MAPCTRSPFDEVVGLVAAPVVERLAAVGRTRGMGAVRGLPSTTIPFYRPTWWLRRGSEIDVTWLEPAPVQWARVGEIDRGDRKVLPAIAGPMFVIPVIPATAAQEHRFVV